MCTHNTCQPAASALRTINGSARASANTREKIQSTPARYLIAIFLAFASLLLHAATPLAERAMINKKGLTDDMRRGSYSNYGR